jgi:hypothetical protein
MVLIIQNHDVGLAPMNAFSLEGDCCNRRRWPGFPISDRLAFAGSMFLA